MNIHDAVGLAFKNGYESGAKDFAKHLKMMYDIDEHDIIVGVVVSDIDDLLTKLIKRKENEGCI